MDDYRRMTDEEKAHLAKKRSKYSQHVMRQLHTLQQNIALFSLSSVAALILEQHPEMHYIELETGEEYGNPVCRIAGIWDENRKIIATKTENRELLDSVERMINDELGNDAIKGIKSGSAYDLSLLAEMEYNIG